MNIEKELSRLFLGNLSFHLRTKIQSTEEGQKAEATMLTYEGRPDWNAHADGEYVVGVSPLTAKNECYFSVIDIDFYTDKEILKHVVRMLHKYEIPLIPFRSKSGGLHLYAFYKDPVDAAEAKETMQSIVSSLCLEHTIPKEGAVEVFPLQTKAIAGRKSHTINVPLFNCNNKCVTYAVDEDLNEVPLEEVIETIHASLTSTASLRESIKNIPFSDAPPCIQINLMTGMRGQTGRNNFFVSVGVYLRAKYGDDFWEKFVEANDYLCEPLPESELKSIYDSVLSHGYKNYNCKLCKDVCNKKLCSMREYGMGKDKGHFTGIDYGSLIQMKTDSPYYVWKLRNAGDEGEYVSVVFKDEDELLNQKFFIKYCVRYLHVAPTQVSPNEWYKIVNKALEHVEEETVELSSDTSDTGLIKKSFINYLVNTFYADAPYLIRTGLVYVKDNVHYFMLENFMNYLDRNKVAYKNVVINEVLRSFGAEKTILTYEMGGVSRNIECWSKAVDDEMRRMSEDNDATKENLTKRMDIGLEIIKQMDKQPEKTEIDLGDF